MKLLSRLAAVFCLMFPFAITEARASIVTIEIDTGPMYLFGAEPGEQRCYFGGCATLSAFIRVRPSITIDQSLLPIPLPGARLRLEFAGGNPSAGYSFNYGEISGEVVDNSSSWLVRRPRADFFGVFEFAMSSSGYVYDWDVFAANDGATYSSRAFRSLESGQSASTYSYDGLLAHEGYRRGRPATVTVFGDLIGVSPVPLPAGGVLLLVGLGALTLVRRRNITRLAASQV